MRFSLFGRNRHLLVFVVNTANVEIWVELINCVWSFGVNPQLQFAIKNIFNKMYVLFSTVMDQMKPKWKFSTWKTKEYPHVVVFYLFYCGKARPGPVTIWSEYGWMGASAAILFSRKDFRKIIKKIFLNWKHSDTFKVFCIVEKSLFLSRNPQRGSYSDSITGKGCIENWIPTGIWS